MIDASRESTSVTASTGAATTGEAASATGALAFLTVLGALTATFTTGADSTGASEDDLGLLVLTILYYT